MKIIRQTYPLEMSVGILLLIFILSFFLSFEIFDVRWSEMTEGQDLLGMLLMSSTIIIMLLILWEEFLFPIQVKPVEGGMLFRNHRTKLIKQLLFYLPIPVIFGFVYMTHEVRQIPFFIWAIICTITPVVGKLISGINNYNDFLKLTTGTVEYKNNEKEGVFEVKDIKHIAPIKDEGDILHKIQLFFKDGSELIIDLDEMELEAFYDSIENYISTNYQSLLKDPIPAG